MSGLPILLVGATSLELNPLLARLGAAPRPKAAGLSVLSPELEVLVTGVGQMQAAYHLGRQLAARRYGLVLNLGIAGSFRDEFPSASVVRVIEETLADLGAEDGDEWLDLFDLKLLERDDKPFENGTLRAAGPDLRALAPFPRVRSVTVNRVLGNEGTISRVRRRFDPDVVNMEGAAVFYACATCATPCIQLRAISDRVERRDKSKWDIPGALRALTDAGVQVLDEIRR